ncbi:MAG: DUF1178 family protein [Gemmobacter sp.]
MIRFSLRCAADHRFDSWFQSSAAYDRLASAGQLSCAVCGGGGIEKAPMAPAIASGGPRAVAHGPDTRPQAGPLSAPMSPQEAAMAALRRHVEEHSEHVGLGFATEARRIHAGEAPARPIHGEARIDEARRLIEEGVPVAPLPFIPARKVN